LAEKTEVVKAVSLDDLREFSGSLLEKIKDNIDTTLAKGVGGRDLANLIALLEKLVRLTGQDESTEWRKKLQEVFAASDAIDELASGQPAKFKKWIFDRHKRKKKLTLA
jgi:hypothetical protein